MIFYLDENLPPNLAEALSLLEKHENESIRVLSVMQEFGRGAKDEEWIPKAGEHDACIITFDYNIHRTLHQRELYKKHSLGIFFFKHPTRKQSYNYWEIVQQLIRRWQDIKDIAKKKRRPFSYIITQRKIEKLRD